MPLIELPNRRSAAPMHKKRGDVDFLGHLSECLRCGSGRGQQATCDARKKLAATTTANRASGGPAEDPGALWELRASPRVTRIGALLQTGLTSRVQHRAECEMAWRVGIDI